MVKRTKRNWHPDFQDYMNMIVNHAHFKGMPHTHKPDGSIRWIVTGKSTVGQEREEWWDKKRASLGIPKVPGWKSVVARRIHPSGEKPCQICGRVMKVGYEYPNKTCPYGKSTIIPCGKELCQHFISNKKTCSHLGPGAMSDCPDRLDGFHTYNRCCRSKEDTGRHASNLARYGEDRRAYTFWADGDWKAASWLMQEFKKHSQSPDHIGPLSLGFCHRPKFEPLTRSQNSAKGNRLTYENVLSLIEDEKNGEQVISDHSRILWDKIKLMIQNDADAKHASQLLRKNLHSILAIFSIIADEGHEEFLIKFFLHPNHALYQHEFKGFDPKTGSYKEIITTKATRTEHHRNAERYIRKSFEALEEYRDKTNRNVLFQIDVNLQKEIDTLLGLLKSKRYDAGKIQIEKIFEMIADKIAASPHLADNDL